MLEDVAVGTIRQTTGDEIDGPSTTIGVYLVNQSQSRSTMSTFGIVLVGIGDGLANCLATVFDTSTDSRSNGVGGWDVFGLDGNHGMVY